MEPVYQLARAVVVPWVHLWFKTLIEGRENVPSRGPALVAFNHIAYLDPLIIGAAVDASGRRPRFLTKSELFEDKRIGWVLRGCGQIEVKRGTRAAPAALDSALRALDRGEVVVIFPEGTVTTDPDLRPLPAKTGASRLALRSGAPVIPGGIWGTANIWPKGSYAKSWRPRQEVLLRFGEQLQVSGSPDDPAEWQRAGRQITDEISKVVASLRPLVPDRRRPV
jgi:1-acyl-sn-glycerol-3-phosphate acyltransferase